MDPQPGKPQPSEPGRGPLIGQHLIAELCDLEPARLRDLEGGVAALRAALELEGYGILDCSSHSFAAGGGGFTCLFLLCESHASLHSYPEYGYLAFDLFSCGKRQPQRVLRELATRLGARIGEQQILPRRVPAAPVRPGR